MTDLATAPDTAQRTVDDWLAAFNAALEAQDAAAAAELFATDGFHRDLVALTWNITRRRSARRVRAGS
jgi:putative flavoprotein involved in K+ transport